MSDRAKEDFDDGIDSSRRHLGGRSITVEHENNKTAPPLLSTVESDMLQSMRLGLRYSNIKLLG